MPIDELIERLEEIASEYEAMASEDSDGPFLREAATQLASLRSAPTYEQGVAAGLEMAAKVVGCAFDDRPRLRSESMDWTDGYYDGTRAAASAIRALADQPSPAEEPKP